MSKRISLYSKGSVRSKVPEYLAARNRLEKSAVISSVVQEMTKSGFRFLRFNNDPARVDALDERTKARKGLPCHSRQRQVSPQEHQEEPNTEVASQDSYSPTSVTPEATVFITTNDQTRLRCHLLLFGTDPPLVQIVQISQFQSHHQGYAGFNTVEDAAATATECMARTVSFDEGDYQNDFGIDGLWSADCFRPLDSIQF